VNEPKWMYNDCTNTDCGPQCNEMMREFQSNR
jgi:hypothetical protein